MRTDPKFGWHIIWLTPLAISYLAISEILKYTNRWIEIRRLNNIIKDNSEIREMSYLSGIRTRKEDKK